MPGDEIFTRTPISKEDEKLINKSTHASRNLMVIGILQLIIGIGFAAVFFGAFKVGEGPFGVFLLLIGPMIILSGTGMILAAIGARHGNTLGITVAAVLTFIGIIMGLIGRVWAATSIGDAEAMGEQIGRSLGALLIPALVLAALASSRRVLVELRKKGLYPHVFQTPEHGVLPSIIGVILIITGNLAAFGIFAVAPVILASEQAQTKVCYERINVIMENEEAELLSALQAFFQAPSPQTHQTCIRKLTKLEAAVNAFDSGGNEKFSAAQEGYLQAIQSWKKGVSICKSGTPEDIQKGMVYLKKGDHQKQQAFAGF